MRTEDLLKQSQSLAGELQSQQEELQQTNQQLEEKAALLAEQNVEVERKNQRSRAGPPGARGEGRAAGADLEVQVRVPREHVARAAHAAQQPADPVRPALAATRTATSRQADRVRQDDPRVGQRPADADQRHPRPVEDRVGHGHRRRRRAAVRGPAGLRRAHVPARRGSQEAGVSRSDSIRTCRARVDTDAKRLQQVLKNLLSNAFKFTERGRSRCASRRSPDGWSPDNEALNQRRVGGRVLRHATPASASRRTSSRSSSRRSSRPTAAPAASTAARAWAWRSAARSRGSSAARSA